jgi:hypothetical protein
VWGRGGHRFLRKRSSVLVKIENLCDVSRQESETGITSEVEKEKTRGKGGSKRKRERERKCVGRVECGGRKT